MVPAGLALAMAYIAHVHSKRSNLESVHFMQLKILTCSVT